MTHPKKTWLEVALNGGASKAVQPLAPHDPQKIIDEALECAEAGASVIHFHAFDGDSDNQVHDADTYGPIIEAIRKHSGAISYGTVKLIGGLDGAPLLSIEDRYRPVEELGEAGLLEWFVMDTGQINFHSFEDIGTDTTGFYYLNPLNYLNRAAELAKKYGAHPVCGANEPGHMRMACALEEKYALDKGVIMKLCVSDASTNGYPADSFGLNSMLNFYRRLRPEAVWGMNGTNEFITHLIPETVKLGGLIRVGLEDAPNGLDRSNLDLVREAATMIRDAGGELESPDGIRKTLVSA